MKTLTTFFVALFTTINSFSQTLIRWDFEINGQSTLSPTYIGDSSLLVNQVAYSDLFPFQGGFTSGVSGQLSDMAANVFIWTTEQEFINQWIEFRFLLAPLPL